MLRLCKQIIFLLFFFPALAQSKALLKMPMGGYPEMKIESVDIKGKNPESCPTPYKCQPDFVFEKKIESGGSIRLGPFSVELLKDGSVLISAFLKLTPQIYYSISMDQFGLNLCVNADCASKMETIRSQVRIAPNLPIKTNFYREHRQKAKFAYKAKITSYLADPVTAEFKVFNEYDVFGTIAYSPATEAWINETNPPEDKSANAPKADSVQYCENSLGHPAKMVAEVNQVDECIDDYAIRKNNPDACMKLSRYPQRVVCMKTVVRETKDWNQCNKLKSWDANECLRQAEKSEEIRRILQRASIMFEKNPNGTKAECQKVPQFLQAKCLKPIRGG